MLEGIIFFIIMNLPFLFIGLACAWWMCECFIELIDMMTGGNKHED